MGDSVGVNNSLGKVYQGLTELDLNHKAGYMMDATYETADLHGGEIITL